MYGLKIGMVAFMMKNNKLIIWHQATVDRKKRETMNKHRAVVIWFTGLSGSGKSTLAHALEEQLHQMNCRTFVLDGDNMRHGLCSNLGFSVVDRTENIRRAAEVAKLMLEAGMIVMTSFISPFQADRDRARKLFFSTDFIEVYCSAPLQICEARDVKGLYARARAGEVKEFTGISSPYESPEKPDLVLDTSKNSLQNCIDQLINFLQEKSVISPAIAA